MCADNRPPGSACGPTEDGAQRGAASAAEAAKALAAAERRLESAAAEKADLQQRFAESQQQLAPLEGRVRAAIAETKVHAASFYQTLYT